MSDEIDFGTLIRELHPRKAKIRFGEINVQFEPVESDAITGNLDRFKAEIDDYSGQWDFKGQPQLLSRRVRIPYNWPVENDNGKILAWAKDYLLVGYPGDPGDDEAPEARSNIGYTPEIFIENVAKADPANVQAIAANQIGLLLNYHEIVQAQSRRSFNWALIGAGVGLAFFLIAAGFTIWTGKTVEAIIPVISGAVVEIVASIVFYLYGKTASQMGEFHGRLERLQLYLVANSMCESLQGEKRDETRSDLIREIAMVAHRAPRPEEITQQNS
jgi:hypothetical protein